MLQEPILLLGKDHFVDVDIQIHIQGGDCIAQIYTVRQALSKSLIAYCQKHVDDQSCKGERPLQLILYLGPMV